jgi:mRNA interferase HigB
VFGDNKYRLIVKVEYELKAGYIRFVGSHAESDKVDASIV